MVGQMAQVPLMVKTKADRLWDQYELTVGRWNAELRHMCTNKYVDSTCIQSNKRQQVCLMPSVALCMYVLLPIISRCCYGNISRDKSIPVIRILYILNESFVSPAIVPIMLANECFAIEFNEMNVYRSCAIYGPVVASAWFIYNEMKFQTFPNQIKSEHP